MPGRAGTPFAARAVWLGRLAVCAAVLGDTSDVAAQGAPAVVPLIELTALAGDWYEIASTGTWWHRHCVSDTRYRFDVPEPGGLRASSICTTPQGVQAHFGRLRAGRDGDGRLSIRFAARLFSWLSATWSDFWVLASGGDRGWLLVGDNRRERLLVLSRTVVLDEAAVAQALAAARQQGYGIDHLAVVPQPAGPTGLMFRR